MKALGFQNPTDQENADTPFKCIGPNPLEERMRKPSTVEARDTNALCLEPPKKPSIPHMSNRRISIAEFFKYATEPSQVIIPTNFRSH
jgi:hypothetical protein